MNIPNRRISNIILLINILFYIPSIIIHVIGFYFVIKIGDLLLILFLFFQLLLINSLFILQIKKYNYPENAIDYENKSIFIRSCLFITNLINLYICINLKTHFMLASFFLISLILNSLILLIPYIVIVIFFCILMCCLPELIVNLSDNNNGLTFHQINLLTSIQLSSDLEDRCNICLSEIKSGETIRILNCKHNFHSECLDKWLHLKNTCPNCRTPIDNTLEESL